MNRIATAVETVEHTAVISCSQINRRDMAVYWKGGETGIREDRSSSDHTTEEQRSSIDCLWSCGISSVNQLSSEFFNGPIKTSQPQ